MKTLNEYPTPETDADSLILGGALSLLYHEDEIVESKVARNLEQRLALCREALERIVKLGESMPESSEEVEIALEILEATKPKP